jgi:hypothetical protein
MNNSPLQHNMTVDNYHSQKANCDNLCDIDHDKISSTNPNLMPCVTCPFCKQLVDAILTPESISCPKCKVTVNR